MQMWRPDYGQDRGPEPRPGRVGLHQRQLKVGGYRAEEIGAISSQSPIDLLEALALPHQGTLYDLDAGRWPGMAVHPAHPPLVMTTYRTPSGSRVDGGAADRSTGVTTELMACSAHTGTHIDALCHIAVDGEWYGGGSEERHLGDLGATHADASSIPPVICRGVLVDIPALLGVAALPAGHPITATDVEAALARQGSELHPHDAVLVRTGYMAAWDSSEEERQRHYGAGLTLDAARALSAGGAMLVGSDTEDFEQIPSVDGNSFLPVHVELLVRQGIYIVELLYLEDLARDGITEFLFLCMPLRVHGATGSMVRPVAIV